MVCLHYVHLCSSSNSSFCIHCNVCANSPCAPCCNNLDTVRKNVKCFADVDEKKIRAKYYVNKELGVKIPVIHFSDLANTAIVTSSDSQSANNRQDISVLPNSSRMQKDWKGHVAKRRRKEPSAQQTFAHLPVIVCVAMYRTDGVLESNVQSIGRSEGVNLWHFI